MMRLRVLPLFVGLALLSGSGCSRSYDGTVVIPRPLDVRRFWDRPPPHVDYDQAQAEGGAFPVAPQPPKHFAERGLTQPAGQRRRQRSLSSSPLPSSTPAKPLACRNVSEPGKRVRMVCD
jgi:hypothetical protein